jgi:hypothetical protein
MSSGSNANKNVTIPLGEAPKVFEPNFLTLVYIFGGVGAAVIGFGTVIILMKCFLEGPRLLRYWFDRFYFWYDVAKYRSSQMRARRAGRAGRVERDIELGDVREAQPMLTGDGSAPDMRRSISWVERRRA